MRTAYKSAMLAYERQAKTALASLTIVRFLHSPSLAIAGITGTSPKLPALRGLVVTYVRNLMMGNTTHERGYAMAEFLAGFYVGEHANQTNSPFCTACGKPFTVVEPAWAYVSGHSYWCVDCKDKAHRYSENVYQPRAARNARSVRPPMKRLG